MTDTASPAIAMQDLAALHAPLRDELRAAFDRVLHSQRFIMGPEVESFEREAADHLGAPHAIGVSSGTDALLVALMALGIGPGDEVITTPFSFFATAGSIARLGATPVFVDIERDTFNLDPEAVPGAITTRSKAVLPVHLFGRPADMTALAEVCRTHGLALIEDAAQAIGAGGLGAGEMACFSMFPAKNLGALGDAGLVTTGDAELAERVRVLRTHGAKRKYHHGLIGGNFRLDALQAALLRAKLPHLDAWTRSRKAHAIRYDRAFREAGLPPGVLTPPAQAQGHVYNQYVIRCAARDALQDHLTSAGIATAIYYPLGLHAQPCFADLGYGSGSLPETESACRQVLALPVHPTLSDAQIDHVARATIAFCKTLSEGR